MKKLIDKLYENSDLTDSELYDLIAKRSEESAAYLSKKADEVRTVHYGKDVYVRGLIEFTNYCRNDCYYCGIRLSNRNVQRYRLTPEEILSCCKEGYELGFRTFVLQGGEDLHYSDSDLCNIISSIKGEYPDCAITLSIGERSFDSYLKYFNAGANRYLLRHESATKSHYDNLHPENMSFEKRLQCLEDLKRIGYEVGCGFMVGSPYQTVENIVQDLRFIKNFNPHMVGIGPYVSQKDTPFRDMENGSIELTLYLLSIIRLLVPKVLLPATTALGTVLKDGRERGVLAGANVIMPNLSPPRYRGQYSIYDNKLTTGSEAAENLRELERTIGNIGYRIAYVRGDSKNI